MNRVGWILFAGFSLNAFGLSEIGQKPEPLKSSEVIWFNQPAVWKDKRPQGGTGDNSWAKDTLAIGNGRIGAMIYSSPEIDRLELNEISFWSGGEAIVDGKNGHKGPKSLTFGSYQPFGTLSVSYEGISGKIQRSLDLTEAKVDAYTLSEKGEISLAREFWASKPADVIIFEANVADANTKFELAFLHPETQQNTSVLSDGTGEIAWNGKLANGLRYAGLLHIVREKAKSSLQKEGNALLLAKGGKFVVYLAMATDYAMDSSKNWRNGIEPQQKVKDQIKAAKLASVSELYQKHLADYQNLYQRCKLNLGKSSSEVAQLPTPKRLAAYRKKSGNDPELEETLFQFGRYLLISSSRPGNLPANLQGLWNYSLIPPWDADYHNNINLQMCYWAAHPTNLAECYLPLIDFISAMAPPARKFTQQNLKGQNGKAPRGWTMRTAQNIYGGQGFNWNIPASAWLSAHLYLHYDYLRDEAYLKNRAYPLMREVCNFWEDYLKPLEAGAKNFKSSDRSPKLAEHVQKELANLPAGTLVAPNAWSPEHGPKEDGVAHDQQIIDELFGQTISASSILKLDEDWARSLATKKSKLDKSRINSAGLLQEWMVDRNWGVNPAHRHTSHLYAVYPGKTISLKHTPELAKAAEKSLEARGTAGDSRRSWTWTWRALLWARLHRGDKAHEMIQGLIRHSMMDSMFATHPPMQVDGNMGIPAAFVEMLVQNDDSGIELLPALPKAWPSGTLSGACLRGNLTISFSWENGKVTQIDLTSPTPKDVKILVNGKELTVKTPYKKAL